MSADFKTLGGDAPLVIGHRGASAYRPEHTLASYKLAIEQGADFIEPDLVVTKDGHLIARHEPEIGGTTDVADHPEFADRQTTKMLDGTPVSGWFAEDFTLAEIKTLFARERIPEIRPANTTYNDLYRIPTLEEVIDLVRQVEVETGQKVGVIPETKHPTYFEYEGAHLDGTPIHQDTSRLLMDTLVAKGFTDPGRVIVQSFELANLIELQKDIMPGAGVDLPLVQLLNEGGHDIAFNFDPAKADLGANPAVYAEFDFPLTAESPTNGDLYRPEVLRAMKALYAEAIGPFKDDILPTKTVSPPVDGNSDGIAQITRQVTGEVTPLLADAHAAGLDVIIYTLRDEEAFQALNPDGSVRPPEKEYDTFIMLGVDGIFTDSPVTGRAAVDRALRHHDVDAGKDHGHGAGVPQLTFLGETEVPSGSSYNGLRIGGLSALTFDAGRDQYYALSDDRSSDARFFTLEIAVGDGRLADGDVIFTGVQALSDAAGNRFLNNSLDPEGLALEHHGTLYLSSEGDANALVPPFVDTFSLDGRRTGELPIDPIFLPTTDQSSGIRNNLAFEALTLTPDGKHLYVGTENALFQDGPAADHGTGSPSRIIEYDARTGDTAAEDVYITEAVDAAPVPPDAFSTNGLVELLALDNKGTLLALERSFSTGVGNDIKLFLVDTQDATDVSDRLSLPGESYKPVEKTLLLDLADLGITLDNIEGMTFGPDLSGGRKSLVLVSDDNFSDAQVTQFLAFGFDLGQHSRGATTGGGFGDFGPW